MMAVSHSPARATASRAARVIPSGLPEEFVTEDLRSLAKTDKNTAGKEIAVFKSLGLIERCGSRGRAYLYKMSV